MAAGRVHILVSGRVQGVFFRYTTKEVAERNGLAGYVRNLADGRVEIVAEGEREQLEKLVAWSHQGPAGASVEGREVKWETPSNSFSTFRITW